MPTTSNRPLLSVIIPAYNEAANFRAGLLTPALEYLRRQKFSWDILFVNDGSSDDTLDLLSQLARLDRRLKVMSIAHGGKAAAVTAGMLAATGRYRLFTDFDQSTPLSHVQKFLAAHRRGADVCIGVRGGGEYTKNDTLIRKIRSRMFVTLVQFIALPGIRDSQCGFKSFTAQATTNVFSHLKVCLPQGTITGGYMGAFDVEVLFLALKRGYSLTQIPVSWIKVPSDKLNVWKEPLMMVRDTLKIRLWDILGMYHASEA